MKKYSKILILFIVVFLLSCGQTASPRSSAPLLSSCTSDSAQQAQTQVSRLFEDIRDDEAMLQFFFTRMPKGGDLHNHLSGSVYAETFFDIALQDGLWLNTDTYVLNSESVCNSCVNLYPGMENEHNLRVQSIDHWSIRNYDSYNRDIPQDEFFFGTWGYFGAALSRDLSEFLIELRIRAQDENVQYLEVMMTSPWVDNDFMARFSAENDLLIALIAEQDLDGFADVLASLFREWESDADLQSGIADYINLIDEADRDAALFAPEVTSYYQAYASRNNANPVRVFAQLYMGFKSVVSYEKLVGVNIVQPENGDYSLRDYWGHMQMFAFLNEKYEGVSTSLHAGELRLGLVPPEDLKNHIYDAVVSAEADRIGHGVSIAFERDAPELLKRMAENEVLVEINLTSNEFILDVIDSEHPLMLYHRSGVPLVLATDDAGILRTNLTQQFVIAAMRYPDLTYGDFRTFVLNSISYSFLPDDIKAEEIEKLQQQLEFFEEEMAAVLSSFNDLA